MKPRFRFAADAALEPKRVRLTPDPIDTYDDRQGFDPLFIDPAMAVPLPRLAVTVARDAATHTWRGRKTHVLDYTHFSVAVSKSRRLPIYSACNIDGAHAIDVPRTNIWKYDPRIDQKYQILKEVYGDQKAGYFSRGHMTRRQDPNWGSKKTARQADADTFHATNAAPQVQGFNGGLWDEVEDYVLANTQRDRMRISVFTGPVFRADDPVVHGIKIPRQFWKVVAFVHDESRALSAIAYLCSQARAVADLEPTFVFGEFQDQQRPIGAIQALTGLTFGDLAQRDVLAGADIEFAVALNDVQDIMLA